MRISLEIKKMNDCVGLIEKLKKEYKSPSTSHLIHDSLIEIHNYRTGEVLNEDIVKFIKSELPLESKEESIINISSFFIPFISYQVVAYAQYAETHNKDVLVDTITTGLLLLDEKLSRNRLSSALLPLLMSMQGLLPNICVPTPRPSSSITSLPKERPLVSALSTSVAQPSAFTRVRRGTSVEATVSLSTSTSPSEDAFLPPPPPTTDLSSPVMPAPLSQSEDAKFKLAFDGAEVLKDIKEAINDNSPLFKEACKILGAKIRQVNLLDPSFIFAARIILFRNKFPKGYTLDNLKKKLKESMREIFPRSASMTYIHFLIALGAMKVIEMACQMIIAYHSRAAFGKSESDAEYYKERVSVMRRRKVKYVRKDSTYFAIYRSCDPEWDMFGRATNFKGRSKFILPKYYTAAQIEEIISSVSAFENKADLASKTKKKKASEGEKMIRGLWTQYQQVTLLTSNKKAAVSVTRPEQGESLTR